MLQEMMRQLWGYMIPPKVIGVFAGYKVVQDTRLPPMFAGANQRTKEIWVSWDTLGLPRRTLDAILWHEVGHLEYDEHIQPKYFKSLRSLVPYYYHRVELIADNYAVSKGYAFELASDLSKSFNDKDILFAITMRCSLWLRIRNLKKHLTEEQKQALKPLQVTVSILNDDIWAS